jgi:hypothetical protein
MWAWNAKLKDTERGARRNSTHGAAMSLPQTGNEVFDREFLPIRAKLLDVAAALDRIDHAGYLGDGDARRTQIQAAIQILLRPENDRAEQLQLIFSRPYENGWREKLGMTNDE